MYNCTSGSMFTGTQKSHYKQVLSIISCDQYIRVQCNIQSSIRNCKLWSGYNIRVQCNIQLNIGINHLAAAALGDCRCPRRFAPWTSSRVANITSGSGSLKIWSSTMIKNVWRFQNSCFFKVLKALFPEHHHVLQSSQVSHFSSFICCKHRNFANVVINTCS